MRARSLHVHGRTFSEPRSAVAHPQGRMPGGRAAWGVFLWLLSLHKGGFNWSTQQFAVIFVPA